MTAPPMLITDDEIQEYNLADEMIDHAHNIADCIDRDWCGIALGMWVRLTHDLVQLGFSKNELLESADWHAANEETRVAKALKTEGSA